MTDLPGSLAAALAALQADLPHISKASEGQAGQRKIRYADLEDVADALYPKLAEYGLLFFAEPTLKMFGSECKFVLSYKIQHVASLEAEYGDYPIAPGNPQQMGSAITYARRYALVTVTGVVPRGDDDDGQGAEQEARAMSRRPPETRADGSATFAEQERMLHDQAGWERGQGPLGRTEWDADPAEQPDPRTSALRAMFALYRELGITDKEQMLANVSAILERKIESRADLAADEIIAINGALRRRRDALRKAESEANR